MRTLNAWLAPALCGAMLAGCHKEEKAQEASPAAPSVAAKPAPAPAVPGTLPGASSTTVTTVTPSPLTPPPPMAPISSATVTLGTHPDAQKLLDDASKQVLAKNWLEAAADFTKLDEMRSEMTPSLKESLNAAEADFASAKSAGRLDVPTTRPAQEDTTPPNK
jgi:hypothetical protein